VAPYSSDGLLFSTEKAYVSLTSRGFQTSSDLFGRGAPTTGAAMYARVRRAAVRILSIRPA